MPDWVLWGMLAGLIGAAWEINRLQKRCDALYSLIVRLENRLDQARVPDPEDF